MESFSDYSFENLDIEKLNKAQVKEWVAYVNSLLYKEVNNVKEVEYQDIKGLLLRRYVMLTYF